MLHRTAVVAVERRDRSPRGIACRKRFADSLELLRTLGLSSAVVEQYRQLARNKHKLPHELVCAVVENAAERDTLLTIVSGGRGPA